MKRRPSWRQELGKHTVVGSGWVGWNNVLFTFEPRCCAYTFTHVYVCLNWHDYTKMLSKGLYMHTNGEDVSRVEDTPLECGNPVRSEGAHTSPTTARTACASGMDRSAMGVTAHPTAVTPNGGPSTILTNGW